MNKFQKFHIGLDRLIGMYGYELISIESVPVSSSFPNGVPNHSTDAYIQITVKTNNPYTSPSFEKEMSLLGWNMEQEGQYWIFKN